MLVPRGEEGRKQAKWFISSGGVFPEHPATPRACPAQGVPSCRQTRPAEETTLVLGLLVAPKSPRGHGRCPPGPPESPDRTAWSWATSNVVEGMEGWAEREAEEAEGPGWVD